MQMMRWFLRCNLVIPFALQHFISKQNKNYRFTIKLRKGVLLGSVKVSLQELIKLAKLNSRPRGKFPLSRRGLSIPKSDEFLNQGHLTLYEVRVSEMLLNAMYLLCKIQCFIHHSAHVSMGMPLCAARRAAASFAHHVMFRYMMITSHTISATLFKFRNVTLKFYFWFWIAHTWSDAHHFKVNVNVI